MTTRPRLNADYLASASVGSAAGSAGGGRSQALAVPGYDRGAVTAGIVHIGVGNFHRVHEAVYVDRCLHLPGQEHWGVHGLGLVAGAASEAKAADFADQDHLYSVTEFAPDGSHSSRVIGALAGYSHAPADPRAAQDRLAAPSTRIVSLTIGESTYNLAEGSGEFDLGLPAVAADLRERGRLPRTVFGVVVAALARRRAEGTAPFTVISCDNLRGNGDTTRRAVLGYARAVDPDLAHWIEDEVSFPNGMVDRIAPQVDAARREELNELTGLDDRLAVLGEDHLQWVLEDRFPAGRPRWEEVGVTFSDEVARYEAVKGRMLNASHVLMSHLAVLMGHRYVHDALADPLVYGLLRTFIDVDVLPLITGPAGVSLTDYRDRILSRFANPAVRDQLLRIASDGAAKIPVFHTVTLRTQVEQGLDSHREALLLLGFRRYLRGVDDRGVAFDVVEPLLSAHELAACRGSDPRAVLRLPSFSALGLEQVPSFIDVFDRLAVVMESAGVAAAVEEAITARR